MHVLFVEPAFPSNQRQFVRALSAVGARVTGLGEAPSEALGGELRSWLDGYERVSSVVDEGALTEAVRRVQRRGWVDRLEATVEAHVLPAASVRETCGIPGTSVRTAFLCRDKPAMKEFLRDLGVPCAASAGVASATEARDFASRIGFPLILKPPDGAGASGARRVDSSEELERAIRDAGIDQGRRTAIEEFVEGHEAFYDTLSIDGEPAHEFVSHYYPGVLEAMRDRRVAPYLITTNRLDAPGYAEVRQLGRRVIRSLGVTTSATHMEWFFGSRGLKFSEIGCRPPGVGTWDLYCAANDLDLYREWASAIVHGRCGQRASRSHSAALLNLRPDRDGRIIGYEGLDEVRERFGESLLDFHLPEPGTPTQPVAAGYMANAWMRLRHPDYDALRGICEAIGRVVRVRAG